MPDEAPKISAEQASETAKAASPFDLPVQQVILARLVRDGPPELVYRDNLVWAVVLSDGAVHKLDGPGGPALQTASARSPMLFTYDLVLVDARTGEFVLAMNGPLNREFVANTCSS